MKLLLLIISFSIHAQNIALVLPEIAEDFHNIRDFTLHENEAYFSAQSTLGDLSVIIRLEKVKNQWSNPSIASFSGQFHDLEPFFSNNGLKLYFASKRPKKDGDEAKDYDIWVVTRNSIQDIWSQPKNMGPTINSDKNEFYPSLAQNGNLYFTANKKDSKGKDDIYFSEFNEGKYQNSYSISKSINTDGDEYNAFIAPDESYIIFGAYKRKDGIGSGDLYISFKDNDGNWGQAVNMGPKINSKQMDYCPFVDSANSLLYFTSKRNNLKKKSFQSIDDLMNSLNSYENGLSRIYKTEFFKYSTTLD